MSDGGWISKLWPRKAAPPPAPPVIVDPPAKRVIVFRDRPRRSYDGAADSARLSGWITSSTDANAGISAKLPDLRSRSRDHVRNSPYGPRAMEALVYGMIGTGIRPVFATGDDDLDKRMSDLWDEWGEVCCTSSPLGIYGHQALIAHAWFESGECLVRRSYVPVADMPGLPPIQLDAYEGDLMPLAKTEVTGGTATTYGSSAAAGNYIKHGIEFDERGRRAAYHLYKTHPGATDIVSITRGRWETIRIPATDMLHLYRETRPGQIRGVPRLAPVLIALYDADNYANSERVRASHASCLVAVVTGGDADSTLSGNAPGLGDQAETEEGGYLYDSTDAPVENLTPGQVLHVKDGQDVRFNQPLAAAGYESTRRCDLRDIAAGIGLSYEVLTGDLSQQNFAAIRLGLNQQHLLLRAMREHVFVPFVMRPIYRWFIEAAEAAGLVPLNDRRLRRVKWSEPQQQAIDRKADVEAAKDSMRAGLSSLREEIAATGRDPDDVLADIAKDQAMRDGLGIVLDSDPRQTNIAGAAQPTGEPAELETAPTGSPAE